MRLGVRLAATMAAVALVPLVTSGIWAIAVARESALSASRAALEREAGAQADFVAGWTRDQLRGLAGFTRLFPGSLSTMSPELQVGLLRAVYNAVPGAVTVALLDPSGAPAVPPVYLTEPVDRPAGSEAGAAALLRDLPQVGGADQALGEARIAAQPTVPVALRATADGWVLGAELALEVADELAARSTPDHAVALLDGQGRLLVGAGHPLVAPALLAPIAGTVSIFDYRLPSGEGVRGASAPVEGTVWTVAVIVPLSDVERAATDIERRLGWVVVGSGLLAVLAAYAIAQSLSQPIGRLRDSALALADGKYGPTPSIEMADEVGELARAFAHLSTRLQANATEISAQRAEIEAFNQELQSRVERRTRELREAQARLVRSGQLAAVAEVGAGLAHELNNPLASILGLAQLLKLRAQPRDQALLADLERETLRCREVADTILRFGQAEAASPVEVDARQVVAEAVHLVSGAFRQRGVALSWTAPPERLNARIDPISVGRLLAQVLNALRAGLPDGARLDVTASRELQDGRPWIAISLRPDRPVASGEVRDDWMAAGLGLWVARQLLDQLGGRLEEPTGRGGEQTEELDRTAIDLSFPVDAPWRVMLPGE